LYPGSDKNVQIDGKVLRIISLSRLDYGRYECRFTEENFDHSASLELDENLVATVQTFESESSSTQSASISFHTQSSWLHISSSLLPSSHIRFETSTTSLTKDAKITTTITRTTETNYRSKLDILISGGKENGYMRLLCEAGIY
jgi:hypothetical protein